MKTAKIFLLSAIVALIGCKPQAQPSQMRIVDLQGNPKPVQMRTPELNMQALQAQGNLTEEKIQAQPRKSDLPQQQAASSNKYGDNFGASSSEAIRNTLQTPTNSQNMQAAPAVSDADILAAGEGEDRNKTIEYSLADNKKSRANEKNAAKNMVLSKPKDEVSHAEVTKKQKGIFVQIGSFSVLQHAKTSLSQIEKFSTKAAPAKIEEAQNGEKTVYRVLIGPFPNKQKASATIAKLDKSGHQAIIIKNK